MCCSCCRRKRARQDQLSMIQQSTNASSSPLYTHDDYNPPLAYGLMADTAGDKYVAPVQVQQLSLPVPIPVAQPAPTTTASSIPSSSSSAAASLSVSAERTGSIQATPASLSASAGRSGLPAVCAACGGGFWFWQQQLHTGDYSYHSACYICSVCSISFVGLHAPDPYRRNGLLYCWDHFPDS